MSPAPDGSFKPFPSLRLFLLSILSAGGLSSLFGPSSPAGDALPLSLTRRRVAAALEALAGECLALADAVEDGALAREALTAVAELAREARVAVAERLPRRTSPASAAR